MKWIDAVATYVKALQEADFPDGCICCHHGISVKSDLKDRWIGITVKSGKLLIMIYGHGVRLFSGRTFRRWKKLISDNIGSIVEYWNGKHGHQGISIIVDVPAPKGFTKAIERYRKLDNVLLIQRAQAGFDEFDKCLQKMLLKIQKRKITKRKSKDGK